MKPRMLLTCIFASVCGAAYLGWAYPKTPLSMYYLDWVEWDEKIGSQKELDALYSSGWRPKNQRIVLASGMNVQSLRLFGDTELAGIEFRRAELDGDNLRELARFYALKWLRFIDCTFPDHSLDHLPSLPKLIGFEAWSKDFQDDDVVSVVSQYGRSLEYFSAADSPISDRGVERLLAMKRLRVLVLCGTKITAASIPILCKMRGLEELDVAMSREQLSGVEALCRIQRALPWIDIRLSDDQCDEVIEHNEANARGAGQ